MQRSFDITVVCPLSPGEMSGKRVQHFGCSNPHILEIITGVGSFFVCVREAKKTSHCFVNETRNVIYWTWLPSMLHEARDPSWDCVIQPWAGWEASEGHDAGGESGGRGVVTRFLGKEEWLVWDWCEVWGEDMFVANFVWNQFSKRYSDTSCQSGNMLGSCQVEHMWVLFTPTLWIW